MTERPIGEHASAAHKNDRSPSLQLLTILDLPDHSQSTLSRHSEKQIDYDNNLYTEAGRDLFASGLFEPVVRRSAVYLGEERCAAAASSAPRKDPLRRTDGPTNMREGGGGS